MEEALSAEEIETRMDIITEVVDVLEREDLDGACLQELGESGNHHNETEAATLNVPVGTIRVDTFLEYCKELILEILSKREDGIMKELQWLRAHLDGKREVDQKPMDEQVQLDRAQTQENDQSEASFEEDPHPHAAASGQQNASVVITRQVRKKKQEIEASLLEARLSTNKRIMELHEMLRREEEKNEALQAQLAAAKQESARLRNALFHSLKNDIKLLKQAEDERLKKCDKLGTEKQWILRHHTKVMFGEIENLIFKTWDNFGDGIIEID